MLHTIAILALWSLPWARGLCTTTSTITSPQHSATFPATAIPTYFPTTVTFTSSFTSSTGVTYRPPFPSKGTMSQHTNMVITSSLVQEWPYRPSTIPFSQSIYIVATTTETVTVRYYPHGTTRPPHRRSEIHTATVSTTSPRSMQVFPFSLTKFPTTLTSTYTTSTSGTTFITPRTMKTIITRVETVTEVWASKPTSLPYTLTQKGEARVTQSEYDLGPDGQVTSTRVVFWEDYYSPTLVVTAL